MVRVFWDTLYSLWLQLYLEQELKQQSGSDFYIKTKRNALIDALIQTCGTISDDAL